MVTIICLSCLDEQHQAVNSDAATDWLDERVFFELGCSSCLQHEPHITRDPLLLALCKEVRHLKEEIRSLKDESND